MTANRIEKRMLDRVKDEFDRREGSVIYDATAPASVEFAELYILADVILKQAFATTADREFLILRAAELIFTRNLQRKANLKPSSIWRYRLALDLITTNITLL